MRFLTLLLWLPVSLALNCCRDIPTDKIAKNTEIRLPEGVKFPDMSGAVYYFGAIDTVSCQIAHGVDSGWMLAFTDENHFVRIDSYMLDESVTSGTYHIENDTLVLNFDSLRVDHEVENVQSGNTYIIGGRFKNKIVYTKEKMIRLNAHNCNGIFPYISVINPKKNYFDFSDAVKAEENAAKTVAQLKSDSIWQLLKIK